MKNQKKLKPLRIMTYENKIKKHRRQATIVNGQYQGVELATQLFQGKKAQAMLLEQKEQRCEDLR